MVSHNFWYHFNNASNHGSQWILKDIFITVALICWLSLVSHKAVSDYLQSLWLQLARFPSPSLSPGLCSNSCPLSQWCYLTISSSASPFSFCLQSSLASVFSNESALRIRWPTYWSCSISTSNEYSGVISVRIAWFDFLAVQGPLNNNLLQHYNLKASVLRCSAFIMVQLSRLHMTTGKIIALTIRTCVGKVMSLLFNTLSRFVIAFLPRSKCLLIS